MSVKRKCAEAKPCEQLYIKNKLKNNNFKIKIHIRWQSLSVDDALTQRQKRKKNVQIIKQTVGTVWSRKKMTKP